MTVRDATPLLAVPDLAAACAFLKECLGFESRSTLEGFAYCTRDQGAIRLVQAPAHGVSKDGTGFMVYIDVDDADAIWAEHQDAILALPEEHRQEPADQPYGQREFLIQHGPYAFVVAHTTSAAGAP